MLHAKPATINYNSSVTPHSSHTAMWNIHVIHMHTYIYICIYIMSLHTLNTGIHGKIFLQFISDGRHGAETGDHSESIFIVNIAQENARLHEAQHKFVFSVSTLENVRSIHALLRLEERPTERRPCK